MRASYNWLRGLSGVDAPPDEVAERLTAAGLEVESVERYGEGLERVVVGEVRDRRPHPKRERLTLVTVFDGEGEHPVVCGAPNVPDPGGRILFARLGASLPNGMTIEERAIGGETSRGMICSEVELHIGNDAEGIVVLEDDGRGEPGAPVTDVLGLRDAVLEIGLTPNRPDCLGHIGLARDLALLYRVPFTLPVIEAPARLTDPASDAFPAHAPERISLADHWSAAGGTTQLSRAGSGPAAEPVRVHLEDPERCPRYGAGLVLGIEPHRPSPFWLRYRLHLLGMRSVSAAVDVTNLVLFEWGHPVHGFDLARLRGRRIAVRRARDGETMTTIDHVERRFTADDLLICDGEGPVAVAGVMGGVESEIGEATEDVLIECAYFEPRSVRRTARRHGIHTDASHRFERGVDPGAVPRVLTRAVTLMQQICGGSAVAHALDVHPRPAERRSVPFRQARAERLVGTDVPAAEARRILEGIGCELLGAEGEAVEARVPSWRPDLGREVDLIEEVARVRGYDAIPTVVPRVRPTGEGSPPRVRLAQRLRALTSAAGLDEVVNYAFVARQELEVAGVSTDTVDLVNPLSEERSVMRTSLLPGLAANARHALRRQVERVRLFELGRTYHPGGEGGLARERRMLACLLAGPREGWIGDEGPLDFYDAKGALTQVLRPLLGADPQTVLAPALETQAPYLHPRKRASVRAGGVELGVVGEVHPDRLEALELDVPAVYAEVDLERITEAADRLGTPVARPLPRFPSVARDIALVVSDEHPAGRIAEALAGAAEGLAEEVILFDLYRGDPVPAGSKSLAFRIVYRDPEATLTDARVDEVHGRVAGAAEAQFGAQRRT